MVCELRANEALELLSPWLLIFSRVHSVAKAGMLVMNESLDDDGNRNLPRKTTTSSSR